VFQRITDAHHEAHMLFVVGDEKPVFDEDGAQADEYLLKFRHGAEGFLAVLIVAEAHDFFDARPVVSGAIEENDLAPAGRCDT